MRLWWPLMSMPRVGHDLDGVAGRRRPAREQAGRTHRGGDAGVGQVGAQQPFCHGGAALVGGADQQDVDGGELTCPPGSDPIEGSALVLTRRSSPGPACHALHRRRPTCRSTPAPPSSSASASGPTASTGRAGGRAGRPAGRRPAAGRRRQRGPGDGEALLRGADAIRTICAFSARYRNPAALVAERLGASPRDLAVSPIGGNEPQVLVNRACLDIAAGDADIVLIGGSEAWRSRSAARAGGAPTRLDRAGRRRRARPGHRPRGRAEPPRRAGPGRRPAHRGLPPLRAGAAGHARAAPSTSTCPPSAPCGPGSPRWRRPTPTPGSSAARTADEIVTATPDNRWVTWPYTKVMCANNAVEQGAGLILCSAERAEALGVPRDRWVFPLAGTEAHDTYAVSHRLDLHSSPAVRLAGRRLFAEAGRDIDDVAHVDLYSCFPSAVQIAAARAGPRPRPAAHRDRRPVVRRRAVEQLREPLDRRHGRRAARRRRVARPGHRQRRLRHQARPRASTRPSRRPARAWGSAGPRCRTRSTPSVPRGLCESHDGAATVESWVVYARPRRAPPRRRSPPACSTTAAGPGPPPPTPSVVSELRTGGEQIGRTVKLTPDGDLLL